MFRAHINRIHEHINMFRTQFGDICHKNPFVKINSFNKRIVYSICAGTAFITIPVCYRYSVTTDDFPKRNLINRIFNIKQPLNKMILENKSKYIDCSGLNPYEVFAHLYNSSQPSNIGWSETDGKVMTLNEAKKLLDVTMNFDFLRGRALKLEFGDWPYLYPGGYDSRNGIGTMNKLIQNCVSRKHINCGL